MGAVRRQVAFALVALVVACNGSDDGAPRGSSCASFPKAGAPAFGTVRVDVPASPGARHVSFAGDRPFVVDATSPYADAVATADAVYATRARSGGFDVLRITSQPASETTVAAIDGDVPADAALPVAVGKDGAVLVGAPDRILELRAGASTVVASGFRALRTIAFDVATGDVWAVDRSTSGDLLHRVRSSVARDAAPPLLLPTPVEGVGVVVRDGASASLEGRYVYSAPSAQGTLVVVDPFGPSGPAAATTYAFAGGVVVGSDAHGAAIVANAAFERIVDESGPAAPASLRETGCLENAEAIAYDVAVPLWSDGAEKERAIVLPPGGSARVMPDGDLRFPVGTVAIKTFSRGGRKVETRLFVQHAIEDWVGYSYAWNAEGTDARLVVGNMVRDDWYFPSASDCNACHTPAAGYTLGIEARQLDDATKERLGVTFPGPRFDPKDARAYLHSNCSVCHRDGSATGIAELDLRFDTPLDRTGLCAEPKAGALGIADARIVAPGAPERSVLVKRMRALDETRMPKLGTHVVDEAGVALVESWIRDLKSCP